MGLSTVETGRSVSEYLGSVEDVRRKEALVLINLIGKVTGEKARLWGSGPIVGFGKYSYRRKNSKEDLEWFRVGFALRKGKISIYLTCDLEKEPLVRELGKCSWGKGCLYVKRLDDIDLDVLEKLILKYKDASWYNEK